MLIFLDEDAREVLSFAPLDAEGAGWARYFSPALDERSLIVMVRIGFPCDEQQEWRILPLAICQMHLASGGSISATSLRKIPFERINAAVSRPAQYAELARRVSAQPSIPLPHGGPWCEELPTFGLHVVRRSG